MDNSKYFSKAELQCKCGCEAAPMDATFLIMLDELRATFGKPLLVSSGYRCPAHNSRVSSTGATGPHTSGKAVDLRVDRGAAHQLLKIAMDMNFSGIGINQKGSGRFIHLDILVEGLRPTVWSY